MKILNKIHQFKNKYVQCTLGTYLSTFKKIKTYMVSLMIFFTKAAYQS